MIEYLIRPAEDEWFDLHHERMPSVLRPSSVASHQVEGRGDHRIAIGDVQVAFSCEDPGIQVSFEGPMDSSLRERIVAEVCENVVRETGQPGRVVPL